MGAAWKFPRTPRTLRLEQDYRDMQAVRAQSTILEFTTEEDPPDRYHIVFRGKTLGPGPEIVHEQRVDIRLGTDYPRSRPDVRWMTPILHPNISGGQVCMGNFGTYWTQNTALGVVVEVLWDMARLKILNPYHAYDRDERRWEELDKQFKFPVDPRPLRDKVLSRDEPSSVLNPEVSDPGDIVILDDDAGTCG